MSDILTFLRNRSAPAARLARRAHDDLGSGPRPGRDQGQPAQLLHVVSSDHVRPDDRRRLRHPGPRQRLSRLGPQALLRRPGRRPGRGRASGGRPSRSSPKPKSASRRRRSTRAPLPSRRSPTSAPAASRLSASARSSTRQPGLNPRYTFDSFVVGPSNQFAHAGLPRRRRIAGALLQPALHLRRRGPRQDPPDARDRALHRAPHAQSAAHLRLVRALHERDDQRAPLRAHPRVPRALPQRRRPAGRRRAVPVGEGEHADRVLPHLQRAVRFAAKQIVISSDCPPHEITSLEERLRSRFEWGLIADIQPPDLETKVAILKKKADAEAVPLPDNVAIYIAGKIKSNIRELEGSLIRLVAYASMKGAEITLPLAQHVLRNVPRQRRARHHHRDHPEVRRRLLQAQAERAQVAQQLEIDRPAAPDRDVHVQEPDARLAARNRQGVRGQAPLDGHPLDPENRGRCGRATPNSAGSSTTSWPTSS